MAYKGPERRVDPGNRMGKEWHSPRTFGRKEFEGLSSEARRKAILEARFRNEGSHFGEAHGMRAKLLRTLDRLERKLDQEKVNKLIEAFERGVALWEEAGLFTPERERAGYSKPVFARDYQPSLTPEILDMTEPGTEFNRGYGTPVFTPMDVPLHNEDPNRLSYFKLLKDALLRAFRGSADGKQPNTLLIGPEKRLLTADQVDLREILWGLERYMQPGVVHDVKKLLKKGHGGVSEHEALTRLTGNEKRTGGVMRLERDQLIMPSDVGEKEMNALDWEEKLPAILPPNADVQGMKQAIAYIIYCLERRGWLPDYYDYNSPATSRVNLVLKSFIPDEGQKGTVPALYWDVSDRQFCVDRDAAGYRDSDYGVRAGVRIKGA